MSDEMIIDRSRSPRADFYMDAQNVSVNRMDSDLTMYDVQARNPEQPFDHNMEDEDEGQDLTRSQGAMMFEGRRQQQPQLHKYPISLVQTRPDAVIPSVEGDDDQVLDIRHSEMPSTPEEVYTGKPFGRISSKLETPKREIFQQWDEEREREARNSEENDRRASTPCTTSQPDAHELDFPDEDETHIAEDSSSRSLTLVSQLRRGSPSSWIREPSTGGYQDRRTSPFPVASAQSKGTSHMCTQNTFHVQIKPINFSVSNSSSTFILSDLRDLTESLSKGGEILKTTEGWGTGSGARTAPPTPRRSSSEPSGDHYSPTSPLMKRPKR